MATATATAGRRDVKEFTFSWIGTDMVTSADEHENAGSDEQRGGPGEFAYSLLAQ